MKRYSEVWLIVKKEMLKFFNNKRLVLSSILLPGLAIFVLYSIMGNFMKKQEADAQIFDKPIYVIDIPEEIEKVFKKEGISCKKTDIKQKNEIQKKIRNKDEVLLVQFPDDLVLLGNNEKKQFNIRIYYDASSTESNNYYQQINTLLNEFESQISNVFDINSGEEAYNLASDKESKAKNIATILPTILMGLIFSACTPIAAESFAGEKERGTIATLLLTPINRRNLVLGKIISLSIVALGGAISSYIGTIISLPQFLNMTWNEIWEVYNLLDYLLLLFTLISTIMLMVSIMTIVSVNARTIKEASMFLTPFSGVVMLLGMTCMIQSGTITKAWIYFIPFYNNVQNIYNTMNFETNLLNCMIMFGSNLFYTGMCIMILAKMLKNEKIILSS